MSETFRGDEMLRDLLIRPGGEEQRRWPLRYEAIEAVVAELLGGTTRDRWSAHSAVRGPDILVGAPDNPHLVVELKVVRQADVVHSIRSRTSELLAAATEARGAYGSDLNLAVFFLVAPADSASEKHDWTRLPEGSRKRLAGSVQRLLRQDEHGGYDSVVLATAGEQLRWTHVSANSSEAIETELGATLSTPDMVTAVLGKNPATSPSPNPLATHRPLRVLLVADEWRSTRGGLSTVNRELAIGLAALGVDTAVMVSEAGDEEFESAAAKGVQLVKPARVPGLGEHETLLLRPDFADAGWEPDVIVGHGRVLGPYAYALARDLFPNARRVHVVHTAATELEAAKEVAGGAPFMARSEERRILERTLAVTADLVVGVGPLLTSYIGDELIGTGAGVPVVCLVPGLRDDLTVTSRRVPTGNQVLFLGRADDFESKGIDIVARALLTVTARWPHDPSLPLTLVVRGVPSSGEGAVRDRLREILGSRVPYVLSPYSDDVADLRTDLARAKAVVMPSRHEGFGLVAWEAIAAEVPVLISARSGAARFLADHGIDTVPSSVVGTVPTAEDLPEDLWADALIPLLSDPDGARERATKLRNELAVSVSWQDAARTLLAAIDEL